MDISSVAQQTTQAGLSGKTLASNFDTFLKLLTAQLQNQDPLEPMDSAKFTEQLVQYSSVEQGIYTNKNLETLIALQQGGGLGSAVSYIGREVAAVNSNAALTGGEANWTYTLPREAASVSLTVTDANGKTVFSGTGPTAAGSNQVAWDGRTNAGAAAPDGIYTLSVKALDSAGATLTTPITLKGKVDSVSTLNGEVLLSVGGVAIKLNDVTAVRDVPATVETDA
jgi:flagellar basal-body rod modification protein FlgD